jgi:hypothetical protein
MVKSPLIILIELIVGLIASALSTIMFILSKLAEFFYSLTYATGFGIFGAILIAGVGSIILSIVVKMAFGAGKDVIILIALVFFVLIILAVMISAVSPAYIVTNSSR